MAKIKVTFQDHGQDFLWWVLEDQKVVDCGPFQASFWVGRVVTTPQSEIAVGTQLGLELTIMGKPQNRLLNYPIEAVEVLN